MTTIGIDLGTTNTVVATLGRPLSAPTQGDAQNLVPSVVAYPPSGLPLVGARARLRVAIDPENTIASAKRLIGMRWSATRARHLQPGFGAELVPAKDGGFGFRTRTGVYRPVEVGGYVVAHAIGRARLAVEELEAAVATVPAAFDIPQRAATVEAVRRAGVPRVGVIEEPVATAVAYLQRANLRHAVVYDLGGGTFDLAIIDASRYPFRVVAHAGDPFLGGDDVDRALAEHVAHAVLQDHGWDLRSERTTFSRLRSACEWAKCALTERPRLGIPISEIDPAAPQDIPPVQIDRALLASIVDPLVRRTFRLCDEVLGQAELRAKDIQAVFLAGGSCALPGLHRHVSTYFGKRARMDLDPTTVVAIGASLVATRPELTRLLDLPVHRRESQPELYPRAHRARSFTPA